MAETHQLEAKLRSLKLSGMLSTLDLRLTQARKDNIGFIHFLELLLEDEVQHPVRAIEHCFVLVNPLPRR